MCTIILLRRPASEYPLLLATNRDELLGRTWLSPGRHWPEYPGVVAGLDKAGGGSWLGVNDRGVVAAVTNRTGTLGPEAGKRSRGGLVLKALQFPTSAAALEEMQKLDSVQYRAFNLILADASNVYWLSHRGTRKGKKISWLEVPVGFSMLTDRDLNDPRSQRIKRFMPVFQAMLAPEPRKKDGWVAWKKLLADGSIHPGAGPRSAMMLSGGEFTTLSSSLIAIPSPASSCEAAVDWWFAAGPPDCTPYRKVEI